MNEDINMASKAGDSTLNIPAIKVREPEVFRGERTAIAVEGWIEALNLYFQITRLEHGQDQLMYALSLLRDDAQLWTDSRKIGQIYKHH
ncbi:hypothetical protein EDC96DRAFT_582219 [Choanephora cucurbitarum]|nr:hypothetical protein EDC96DRAFT_582219 [Choanephora cucurbitarum]